MTIPRFPIKTAFAALLVTGSAALAEGVPYATCEYPGQYAHCPGQPADIRPPITVEGGTSFSKATAKQRQAQRQQQSQTATGGNASIVTGDDVLSQALRNAITINNGGQVASSAIASTCSGSVEGGCMSAAIQVAGWGVSVNAAKGFVGHHIAEAEDRFKRGDKALVVYLSRFDKNAEGAFRDLGYITREGDR